MVAVVFKTIVGLAELPSSHCYIEAGYVCGNVEQLARLHDLWRSFVGRLSVLFVVNEATIRRLYKSTAKLRARPRGCVCTPALLSLFLATNALTDTDAWMTALTKVS